MPKVGKQVKEKKKNQLGGGWAKHAYGPVHPLSNRRMRRLSKQDERALATTLQATKNDPDEWDEEPIVALIRLRRKQPTISLKELKAKLKNAP